MMDAVAALSDITSSLGPQLSAGATITPNPTPSNIHTWSNFNKKTPSALVRVATEEDAVQTVRWATSHKVPFNVKGGGHSVFCTIGEGGIIIDLGALNSVDVNETDNTVTVGGGVLTEDVIAAVHKKGRCVVSGICDTVGAVGALLAGGIGPLTGTHGLIADSLVSARVITASGSAVTVSSVSHPDLFWGLRGAGPSFGLVTSATLRTHPLSEITDADGTVSNIMVVWSPDSLAAVTTAVSNFAWHAKTSCYFGFLCAPPDFNPTIITFLLYFGSSADAEREFAPILGLSPGPIVCQAGRIPYHMINALEKRQHVVGDFKSKFGLGLNRLTPKGMGEAWELYNAWLESHLDTGHSSVIMEIFGMEKVKEIGQQGDAAGAFAHRDVKFWGFALAWYADADAHEDAERWGNQVREVLRAEDGGREDDCIVCYPNFARGNEDEIELFRSAQRVEKLKALKAQWDPEGVFRQLAPQL